VLIGGTDRFGDIPILDRPNELEMGFFKGFWRMTPEDMRIT
jgi:hypothetical protein